MNKQALAMLKGLLSMSGRSDELVRFLAKDDSQALQNLSEPEKFNPHAMLSLTEWPERIHFSWFSQKLKDYPPAIQALYLGVMPASQVKGVKELLHIDTPARDVSPFLRPFLLDTLRKTIEQPDLVDPENLPPSDMNCLLLLQRKDLVQTIDFLGLYDLAADVRQVVDKELLGKIYRALSPQQLHFLHYCSKQTIKWVSAKLGLLAWDGSKKQLNNLLHHRGLIRLAKAIYKEDPSFKWHLMHRLDTGRAKIIQKELYQKQDPSLIPYFKNQVLHIAKRYLP